MIAKLVIININYDLKIFILGNLSPFDATSSMAFFVLVACVKICKISYTHNR